MDDLLAHLDSHLPLFTGLPGVIGLTLNGGLSRGYGDHLSEIDITFYLQSETYQQWQQGHAPFGVGIQRIDGMLYDIKHVDLVTEDIATWSDDARWDASYSQVLYDPSGKIAALLAQNEQYRPKPINASGVLFSAWWHYKLAGDIWIYRNDPLQAHLMLNQAVTELVKAVYMANSEFVAHEKWLIHMSRTLAWTPEHWPERLVQLLGHVSPDMESVTLRQRHIGEVWQEVDAYIMSMSDKPYPVNVTQRFFYDLLTLLIEKQSMPLADWQQVAGMGMLNIAPFNLCVSVTQDSVVLDKDKLAALTPDDLYSWYYEVVEATRP